MRATQSSTPAPSGPESLRAAVREALSRELGRFEVPAQRRSAPTGGGRPSGGAGAAHGQRSKRPSHGGAGRGKAPNVTRPLRRRGG